VSLQVRAQVAPEEELEAAADGPVQRTEAVEVNVDAINLLDLEV
jgi:hypothetical protein